MRLLRSLITAPTLPCAIIYPESSHLLDAETTLTLADVVARLFCTFDARPLKTFVELAENPSETVARGDVTRRDLDRALDDDLAVLELNLLDPAAVLEQLPRALVKMGAVLEGLRGHVRADHGAFFEEKSVAG